EAGRLGHHHVHLLGAGSRQADQPAPPPDGDLIGHRGGFGRGGRFLLLLNAHELQDPVKKPSLHGLTSPGPPGGVPPARSPDGSWSPLPPPPPQSRCSSPWRATAAPG